MRVIPIIVVLCRLGGCLLCCCARPRSIDCPLALFDLNSQTRPRRTHVPRTASTDTTRIASHRITSQPSPVQRLKCYVNNYDTTAKLDSSIAEKPPCPISHTTPPSHCLSLAPPAATGPLTTTRSYAPPSAWLAHSPCSRPAHTTLSGRGHFQARKMEEQKKGTRTARATALGAAGWGSGTTEPLRSPARARPDPDASQVPCSMFHAACCSTLRATVLYFTYQVRSTGVAAPVPSCPALAVLATSLRGYLSVPIVPDRGSRCC